MSREGLPEITSSYRKAGGALESSYIGQFCNWICNLLFSLVIAVGIYLIWSMMGKPSGQDAMDFIRDFNVSDFTNVLDNITEAVWDNGFNEDPYVGDNTTNIWQSATAGGLSLVLQNALDDDWQTEFEAALEDWQESEVLELTAVQVEVDNSCTRVAGVMKVCNGNFGDTGWLGINEIELEYASRNSVGYIISSVAKMNEYYLNNADYYKRQYTMCHEIGHGFGLPHTDENFYNSDTGNCLDYTNFPQNNLHPGEVNMDRLKLIYGWTEDDDYLVADDAYVAAYDDDDAAAAADDNVEAADDAVQQQNDDNAGQRNLRRVILTHYLPVSVADTQ